MIVTVNEKAVFVIYWDEKLPSSNRRGKGICKRESSAKLKFTESSFLTKGYQEHVQQQ